MWLIFFCIIPETNTHIHYKIESTVWQPWRCTHTLSHKREPSGRSPISWQTPAAVLLGYTAVFPLRPHSPQAVPSGGTRVELQWALFAPRSPHWPGWDFLRAVLQSLVLYALLSPSSSFTGVRPASCSEGSPCLLLLPPSLILHNCFPLQISCMSHSILQSAPPWTWTDTAHNKFLQGLSLRRYSALVPALCIAIGISENIRKRSIS